LEAVPFPLYAVFCQVVKGFVCANADVLSGVLRKHEASGCLHIAYGGQAASGAEKGMDAPDAAQPPTLLVGG